MHWFLQTTTDGSRGEIWGSLNMGLGLPYPQLSSPRKKESQLSPIREVLGLATAMIAGFMFPQFYKAQLLHPSQAFHSCHSLSLGYQASLKHNPISTFSTFLLDNFSCHGANEARIGCGTPRGCHRRGQPQGAHNFHVRCCHVSQEDLLVDILLCHERCGMVMYPSSPTG